MFSLLYSHNSSHYTTQSHCYPICCHTNFHQDLCPIESWFQMMQWTNIFTFFCHLILLIYCAPFHIIASLHLFLCSSPYSSDCSPVNVFNGNSFQRSILLGNTGEKNQLSTCYALHVNVILPINNKTPPPTVALLCLPLWVWVRYPVSRDWFPVDPRFHL